MISARVKFDRTDVDWPEVSMWTLWLLLAVGLMVIGLSGCCRGHVAVGAIEAPVMSVTKRHDDYVKNDVHLSETEQDTYLLTTELLRKIVLEAKQGE